MHLKILSLPSPGRHQIRDTGPLQLKPIKLKVESLKGECENEQAVICLFFSSVGLNFSLTKVTFYRDQLLLECDSGAGSAQVPGASVGL